MRDYSLAHLSDPALIHGLRHRAVEHRLSTAELLAHIAEVDLRRLHAPAGYESMHAYCVRELHFSEDVASKRIRAARAAREFPVLFEAIAHGRLHLAAVVTLAPHLTRENAEALVAVATHRTRVEIEQLLAERFPRPDLMEWVEGEPTSPGENSGNSSAPGRMNAVGGELPDGAVGAPTYSSAAGQPQASIAPARVAPLSAQRVGLQVTIGQGTYEKLRRAQSLLGHGTAPGDLAAVLDRALDALVRELEKRKFAASERPRARRRGPSTHPRHVPAEVKRAVWQRDGGRCTFAGDTGHRCEARDRLEFDHIEPVARGGRATAGNLRLRCRTHNQLEAERAYGAEFMRHKREAEGERVASERSAAVAEQERAAARRAQAVAEVIPWLRQLGFRIDEARRAAALCERTPDAPLEERVRLALTCFAKPRNFRSQGSPQTVHGTC